MLYIWWGGHEIAFKKIHWIKLSTREFSSVLFIAFYTSTSNWRQHTACTLPEKQSDAILRPTFQLLCAFAPWSIHHFSHSRPKMPTPKSQQSESISSLIWWLGGMGLGIDALYTLLLSFDGHFMSKSLNFRSHSVTQLGKLLLENWFSFQLVILIHNTAIVHLFGCQMEDVKKHILKKSNMADIRHFQYNITLQSAYLHHISVLY